ncbi:hypothetical protein SAMN05216497_11545, partial [Clostridium cochlearium]
LAKLKRAINKNVNLDIIENGNWRMENYGYFRFV